MWFSEGVLIKSNTVCEGSTPMSLKLPVKQPLLVRGDFFIRTLQFNVLRNNMHDSPTSIWPDVDQKTNEQIKFNSVDVKWNFEQY